jgi:eukaryotic-like serine/threonine-protein kinase
MEYVKGDDLEDLIQQRALSQSQFLEVLAQICEGLSFAHRNGIVHRDIKPTNVRVIRDGKRLLAKVMDFGIARIEDSGMTATGIVMGTVSYMAPEYIQSGKAAAQCDLWAVGVMLYECLAGRKPFHADNTTTILFKIVSETPKPVEPGAIQGVSPSISLVLEKALAKDPALRFQTADDFAKALRACKDPSFIGSIEEATSRIFQKQQALAEEQNGTTQLPSIASQALPAPSAPTVVSAAPTAVMPPAQNTEALTTMLQPQTSRLTQQVEPMVVAPPPAKGGSKAGIYIAALIVLGALGVGGWYLFGRKKPAGDAVQTPQTTAALGTQTPSPNQTSSTSQSQTASIPVQPVPVNPQPKPGVVNTQPVANNPKPEPPKPEPPKPQPPPKPVEDTPAQKLDKAVAMIGSNPSQAASILRGLALSQPGDPAVQGNLLAALYRSRNAGEFERVLDAAKGRGLSPASLMKPAPAFRQAMEVELAAQKAKNGTNVLPPAVLIKAMK